MITGKTVMSGHNVSHAQNKTKRKFLPNLHSTSVYSEALEKMINLRISQAGLRTIDHCGGLDAFIMKTALTKLDPALRPLKAKIEKTIANRNSAAKAA